MDEDSLTREGSDDLVDILLIDHTAPVGDLVDSLMQGYSGIYGFAMMDLSISVSCVENFQGSDCTQCVPGLTGTDCLQVDDCFGLGVNCSGNGHCVDGVDSFNCSCDPGFTGELCQTNINECVGVDCSGNGECLDGVNSFTCECNPGYTGQVCDNAIAKGMVYNILVQWYAASWLTIVHQVQNLLSRSDRITFYY